MDDKMKRMATLRETGMVLAAADKSGNLTDEEKYACRMAARVLAAGFRGVATELLEEAK